MTTESTTSVDDRARARGVEFREPAESYLNLCARAGNLYLTSGHTSATRGKVGADLTVEQGAAAATESILKLLASVRAAHGTLDGLRVVRLLACVNAAPDFTDHSVVINAASDLIHEVFGPDDGYHARSALGFSSLPGGAAVEIEGVFEIVAP